MKNYLISTDYFEGGSKIGDLYFKGDYNIDGDTVTIFEGEVIGSHISNVLSNLAKNGVQYLSKKKGNFFAIQYNKNMHELWIASDRMAQKALFYFFDEKTLTISNSFWELVNQIAPSLEIDEQSIKEFAAFGYTLSFNTIIKNMMHFPPASICLYSLQKKQLMFQTYRDFFYIHDEKKDTLEAVQRFDEALDQAVLEIMRSNEPNTVYGLGLSGGLDSRLIPHYVLKHNGFLRLFNINELKPNNLFIAQSLLNARSIAQHYHLQLTEIPYNSSPYTEKSLNDLMYYPSGPSQIFVCEYSQIPSFNVLLNGIGGGELWGSNIPHNVLDLSKENLVDYIIERYSYLYHFETITLKRFSDYIYTGKIPPRRLFKRHSIDGIFTSANYEAATSTIYDFINSNADKSNISILQKYLFNIGNKAFYSGFNESMHGKKNSYSVYLSQECLDEALTWPSKFLIHKKLQEIFLHNKFPQLSKIPSEDYKVPIYYRITEDKFAKARKILRLVEWMLRGTGLRFYDWAWNDKNYRQFSLTVLRESRSNIFGKIFDIEAIIRLPKYDMRIYENLVKLIQILDAIENKEYRKFI